MAELVRIANGADSRAPLYVYQNPTEADTVFVMVLNGQQVDSYRYVCSPVYRFLGTLCK